MTSIEDLRRSADMSDYPQAHMLAAINAVAELVGDDHAKILAVLQGAYVTVACAADQRIDLLLKAVQMLTAAARV